MESTPVIVTREWNTRYKDWEDRWWPKEYEEMLEQEGGGFLVLGEVSDVFIYPWSVS